jgi:hypothetical protein
MGSAQCGHVRVFVEIDKAVTPSKGGTILYTLDVRAAVQFCSLRSSSQASGRRPMSRSLSSGAHSRDPLLLAMTTKMNTRSRSRRAAARRQVVPARTARLRTMLLLVKIGSLETRAHDGRCLTWFGEIRSPARRVESRRIWRAKRTSDKPRALRGRQ